MQSQSSNISLVAKYKQRSYRNCAEMSGVCENSMAEKRAFDNHSTTRLAMETIGTDLFELEKKHCLLVVDYFSRFPEVILLKSTTSTAVITALKSIFSRYGIPEEVRSDNGPQYSSMEFAKFASTYGFNHITSSPLYPQSNGQAERTVQTVKQLIKKSNDPYLALMSYRATPLTWCNFSPSELLMGRKIRTTIPQTGRQSTPQWSYLGEFRRLNNLYKQRQKHDFDRNHGVKELATRFSG